MWILSQTPASQTMAEKKFLRVLKTSAVVNYDLQTELKKNTCQTNNDEVTLLKNRKITTTKKSFHHVEPQPNTFLANNGGETYTRERWNVN